MAQIICFARELQTYYNFGFQGMKMDFAKQNIIFFFTNFGKENTESEYITPEMLYDKLIKNT